MKNNQLIIIRTEANTEVALGHLKRCLAICDAIREIGHEIVIVADDDPEVASLVKATGARFVETRHRVGGPDDLAFMIKLIDEESAFAVLIDSYKVTYEYLAELRKSSCKLILLDDIADRAISCDLVINGNPGAKSLHYQGEIGKFLLGTAYVPLARPYWDNQIAQPADQVSSVLITMGGVDHYGLSQRILHILAQWKTTLAIHVVIGPYFENEAEILEMASRSPHQVHLHKNPNGLAAIIEKADIGISAGGQTLYELASYGRPTLGIALWPNQELNVRELGSAGAIVPLKYEAIPEFDSTLAESIFNILGQEKLRQNLAVSASQCVDGQGARRIAASLSKF